MEGKITLSERVGRSIRGNPFMSLWGEGSLLVLMLLAALLVAVGGRGEIVLWVGLGLFVAYFIWLALLTKWSRLKFLRRVGQRRRRAGKGRSTDTN